MQAPALSYKEDGELQQATTTMIGLFSEPLFYREEVNGPEISLPDGILARNLERDPYSCICDKTWSEGRNMWIRPRSHPRKSCLHGIAINMKAAKGLPVRDRQRSGK